MKGGNRHLKLRHVLRTARAFRQAYGAGALKRRLDGIRALQSKLWNGHAIYRVRCDADFGCGPHTVWLPSHCLLSLKRVRCAWHF